MQMLTSKQKIIAAVGMGIILAVIAYYYISSTKEVYHFEDKSMEMSEEQEETEQEEEKDVVIHVTGAVKNQGIVEVKENARIHDVIEEAGGIVEGADLTKVNLAYLVEDGQKIYIPFEKEGEEETDDGEIIGQGAGEDVIEEETQKKDGVININTASLEKLQEIPGIGSATAQKIIAYRTENREI